MSSCIGSVVFQVLSAFQLVFLRNSWSSATDIILHTKSFHILQDLADLEAYRAALKEVNMYISQVENIVSTKLDTSSRFVDPLEEYKTSTVTNCKNVFLWTCNAKRHSGNNAVKEYDTLEYW